MKQDKALNFCWIQEESSSQKIKYLYLPDFE